MRSMATLKYDTSFGFDKNIIIDNLEKFEGSYNMMSGFNVFWKVQKGHKPAGLSVIQWNIDIYLKPDKSRDKRHLETAIIVWDREQPENVYHKAMEAILDKVREINILSMNEQILTYHLDD
jgi:hypothetical protein